MYDGADFFEQFLQRASHEVVSGGWELPKINMPRVSIEEKMHCKRDLGQFSQENIRTTINLWL